MRSTAAHAPTAVGLLAIPITLTLAFVIAPHLALGDASAAFVTFAGAVLCSLGALAVLVASPAPLRFWLVLDGAALVALAGCALSRATSPTAVIIVDTALVALAAGSGGVIGRRIEHPGHLMPATVVASAADFASVVSPVGPSHAIVASERALALTTISFPVPGTHALAAPSLGVGDLIFVALVLGAARTHGLPYLRILALAVVGAALAALASYWMGMAVPALPSIGAAMVLGVPATRRLRSRDKTIAAVGVAAAAALGAASLASRFLTF